MNSLDKQYQELLQTILDYGVEKNDRTGTGTKSIFGYTIRHNMKHGFPLLTTKKMYFKGIVTELLWFLRGSTDLRYLLENGCHIWTGDAYKVYDKDFDREHPPFSAPYPLRLTVKEFEDKIMTDDSFNYKYGNLGPIYGKQWRSWATFNKPKYIDPSTPMSDKMFIDQIANLIRDLKTNPDSRRLMVSAWNVGELDSMTLPPCHYGFQVYTRELTEIERYVKLVELTNRPLFFLDYGDGDVKMKEFMKECDELNIPTRAISLMFNMRSVDTGLGLSFNIASYSLLLMMIAKQVNMVPYEVIGNLGDVHLYLNHIEPIKEQLTREPYPLPTVKISDRVVNDISEYTLDDIILENYQSHPTIKMPLSN